MSTTIYDCPQSDLLTFLDTRGAYNLAQNVVLAFNILVNSFVMYCIVFRSTREMSSYRWYLLIHQVTAFSADIFMSVFARQVVAVPFPIIFSDGLLYHLVHCRYVFFFETFVVNMSVSTMGVLVVYRYCMAKGYKKIVLKYKILLILTFLCAVIQPILTQFAFSGDKEMDFYKNNYSCVAKSFENITNACAYKTDTFLTYCGFPICLASTIFVAVFILSVIHSYRAINIRVLSHQLKHAQKLYMLQLCLQFAIPFSLFSIPLIGIATDVVRQRHQSQTIYDACLTIFSTFSLTGGIVLVIMNKSYYTWLYKKRRLNAVLISHPGQSGQSKTAVVLGSSSSNYSIF